MARDYKKDVLASFFLRLGLAVVFFYAAVASFVSPDNWIGFLPDFLRHSAILFLFSAYELTLGLWLLSNKKTFYAAGVSGATMLMIIAFNITLLDIVFRDVAIFFMAAALAALTHERK